MIAEGTVFLLQAVLGCGYHLVAQVVGPAYAQRPEVAPGGVRGEAEQRRGKLDALDVEVVAVVQGLELAQAQVVVVALQRDVVQPAERARQVGQLVVHELVGERVGLRGDADVHTICPGDAGGRQQVGHRLAHARARLQHAALPVAEGVEHFVGHLQLRLAWLEAGIHRARDALRGKVGVQFLVAGKREFCPVFAVVALFGHKPDARMAQRPEAELAVLAFILAAGACLCRIVKDGAQRPGRAGRDRGDARGQPVRQGVGARNEYWPQRRQRRHVVVCTVRGGVHSEGAGEVFEAVRFQARQDDVGQDEAVQPLFRDGARCGAVHDEAPVEARVVRDDAPAARELGELLDGNAWVGGAGHVVFGDARQLGNGRRDGAPGVDEGVEMGHDLVAAHDAGRYLYQLVVHGVQPRRLRVHDDEFLVDEAPCASSRPRGQRAVQLDDVGVGPRDDEAFEHGAVKGAVLRGAVLRRYAVLSARRAVCGSPARTHVACRRFHCVVHALAFRCPSRRASGPRADAARFPTCCFPPVRLAPRACGSARSHRPSRWTP